MKHLTHGTRYVRLLLLALALSLLGNAAQARAKPWAKMPHSRYLRKV